MNELMHGHSVTAKNIFDLYKRRKRLKKERKVELGFKEKLTKATIYSRIFIYAFSLIIDDIIENGVRFRLPISKNKHGYIVMDKVSGDKFKNAYSKFCFREVDFLMSNFKAYFIALEFRSNGLIKRIRIHVGKRKFEIANYTNNGREYF